MAKSRIIFIMAIYSVYILLKIETHSTRFINGYWVSVRIASIISNLKMTCLFFTVREVDDLFDITIVVILQLDIYTRKITCPIFDVKLKVFEWGKWKQIFYKSTEEKNIFFSLKKIIKFIWDKNCLKRKRYWIILKEIKVLVENKSKRKGGRKKGSKGTQKWWDDTGLKEKEN